jgi:zinc protease
MLKVLVFILCFFISTADARIFGAQDFTLDNGLKVVVIPNHKAPVVKLMLWYKVGSVDEPLGKGGLAHLLEHLMFRGTKKVKGSSFNDIIEAHGGDSNAFTSHDFTVYHEFLDISRLEVALALEADRMQHLQIDDEAFETERKIVFQERKQRVSNNPFAGFGEILNKTLWQNNPYARPVTGLEDEILSITKEDVISFYDTYYSPDNAVLILSGDIDVVTARKLVNKYFQSIPNKKNNHKEVSFNVVKNSSFKVEQKLGDIKQARYIKKYIINKTNKDFNHILPLMLFSNYFGETDNSYLKRNYVLTGKMISASSSCDAFNRGQGTFAISVVSDEVSNVEEIVNKALLEALSSFGEKQLEEEKKKILSSLVYMQDDPESAASVMGRFYTLGFPINKIEAYAEYVKGVGLEDVKKAVSDMLTSSTNISAFLLPEENGDKSDE